MTPPETRLPPGRDRPDTEETGFPRVREGALLAYRLFDVADEIELDRAEALLEGAGERLRLAGERSGFLDLPERPLTLDVGPREIDLGAGVPMRALVHVRLFAHGVASVRYEIGLPDRCGPDELANLVRTVSTHPKLEAEARREAEAVSKRLADALAGPHRGDVFETYHVVFVKSLEGEDAVHRVEGPSLARVLLGEPPSITLSEQTVRDVTRHRFAYAADDLCVLDWDTAFVVEPSGDRSVADVLELASAQLLEFRYYDELFEQELITITDLLRRPRGALAWLFLGRYGRILRRVLDLVVESAGLIERVENAVRVVGDLYLARIYRAAAERLRIPAWQAGVLRRQSAAADVTKLLRDEANAALGHVLEGSILFLIVVEIGLAILRGG